MEMVGALRQSAAFPRGRGRISTFAVGSGGKLLVTANSKSTLHLWKADGTPALLRAIDVPGTSIESVGLSPDEKQLLAIGHDKLAYVYEVETGDEVRRLAGHDELLRGVGWSRDGKLLATSSADKTVKLWDAATGEERRSLAGPRVAPPGSSSGTSSR